MVPRTHPILSLNRFYLAIAVMALAFAHIDLLVGQPFHVGLDLTWAALFLVLATSDRLKSRLGPGIFTSVKYFSVAAVILAGSLKMLHKLTVL